MEFLKFKIPLLMMSMTEIATDPKSPYGCVVRKMEELNISEIGNINNLSAQY